MALCDGYDAMRLAMSKPHLRAELESDLKRSVNSCPYQGCTKLTYSDWIFDFVCENFRNFRFWCWFWRATTLFEIFDFDFEQDFATSKLLVAISKYNLKLSTFSDIFEQWHAGKMGLWRHCYLIRIFKKIILVVVLVLIIAAEAYWFWFWFRICSK